MTEFLAVVGVVSKFSVATLSQVVSVAMCQFWRAVAGSVFLANRPAFCILQQVI